MRSETRDSRIREITTRPIQRITKRLHHWFPDLSPDHLTALGMMGVVLGSVLAERRKRKAAAVILPLSSLMDAIDGSLAREIARESPEKADFTRGQILDACSDRVQEAATALSRAIQAHHRGDRVGEGLAYLAALTNPLPSLARSSAEASGRVVPEAGRGMLGLFGTRIGRTLPNIAATVFPEIGKVPLQWGLDALTAVANTVTTLDRLRQRRPIEAESESLGPKKRQEASARNKALMIVTGAIAGAALLTYASLRRKRQSLNDPVKLTSLLISN